MNSREKEIFYETEVNPQVVKDNTKQLEKIGQEKFYQEMVAIDYKNSDVLNRAKLWIIDKVFRQGSVGRVLDAGCGVGGDCYRLETFGNEVVGVDKSTVKIDFCKKLEGLYKDKKVKFQREHLANLSFNSKEFDVCYSSMMLEHMRSPQNGLQEMGRVAKKVCGIVHMGQKADDNIYHTRFLHIVSVKHLLDTSLKSGYVLETIDEYVFAVFYGESGVDKKSRPSNETYLCDIEKILDLEPNRWVIDKQGMTMVSLDKIEETFVPGSAFSERVVEDYVSCYRMFGLGGVVELSPIRLVHYSNLDVYRVCGDGSHRICALKRLGTIKEIEAFVIVLKLNRGKI